MKTKTKHNPTLDNATCYRVFFSAFNAKQVGVTFKIWQNNKTKRKRINLSHTLNHSVFIDFIGRIICRNKITAQPPTSSTNRPASAKYRFQKCLKTSFLMTGLQPYVTSAPHSNRSHIFVQCCWHTISKLVSPQWVAAGRSRDPCCMLC